MVLQPLLGSNLQEQRLGIWVGAATWHCHGGARQAGQGAPLELVGHLDQRREDGASEGVCGGWKGPGEPSGVVDCPSHGSSQPRASCFS